MKFSHRGLLAVALLAGSTAVCAATDSAMQACVGGSGASVRTFKFDVSNAEWKSQVLLPHAEQMPESQRSAMGASIYRQPSASFLAVNLTVTNTGKSPYTVNQGDEGVYYRLVNADGAQYMPSDFGTVGSIGTLNPGMPVTGTLVFDVPKGLYWLRMYELRDNPNQSSRLTKLQSRALDCFIGAAGDPELTAAAGQSPPPPTAQTRQECIQEAVLKNEDRVEKKRLLASAARLGMILGGAAVINSYSPAGYSAVMHAGAAASVINSAADISESMGISKGDAEKCLQMPE